MKNFLKSFIFLALSSLIVLAPIELQASNFLTDTFTGTPGTALASHTSDSGATWTLNASTFDNVPSIISPSGHIRLSTAAASNTISQYTSSATPNSANYGTTVTCIVYSLTSYQCGAVARFLSTADQGYTVAALSGAHTIDIVRRNSTSILVLDSSTSFTPTVGVPFTIGIIVNGTSISAYLNGALQKTVTDSFYTATGKAGTFMSTVTTPADTTTVDTTGIIAFNAAADQFAFTGPSSGNVGVASTNFTVDPDGLYTGTVSLSDGSAGGTFTPTSLTFSGTNTAQTFTYTPATAGAIVITPTASPTVTNNFSPTTITYTASTGAATSYTLTGPSSGNDGVASTNFTVTPNGLFTGTITPHTSGTGTFTPTSLTYSSSSASQTFTYTPTTAVGSPHSISTTNSGTLTNPSAISYTVNPGALTLTSPVHYQTFQRQGVLGTIVIAGTNGDSATHSIQASFNGRAYATIATNVTGGGTFSGSLTGQAQGQGTLTVRYIDLPSVTATVATVGIGDIYIIAGQSNATGQIGTVQSAFHQTLIATAFKLNYTWAAASDPLADSTGQVDSVPVNGTYSNGAMPSGNSYGNTYWMTLASYLMATNGVPVAYIFDAQNGAGLVLPQSGGYQWSIPTNHQDRTTLYGAMVYRALQQPGGVKAVLWHQGETDAINGSSQASYASALINLAQNIKADLGVPLIAAVYQKCTSSSTPLAAQQAIWAGIRQAAGTSNSNVILGPDLSVMTADATDGLHLYNQADAYEAAALWSQTLGVVNHRWTH